ncbi:MAG: ribbon-helix-helix protein, CopG family [Clostridia bacterium]|nr:ribbon-helix-helix protein, CopG family [Oscillospiraceae bacterium]MBQ7959745.1 ribbon-helix-helix protein, CopG family [Clostridia bacterium]
MMNSMDTTRITATLPVSFIDELKALAKSNQIPSVNFAIRQAVDDYLVRARKKQYDEMMKEAAKDEAFVTRTSKCDEDFAFADGEVQGEW